MCNAGIASVGAFQEIPDVTNYSSQIVIDVSEILEIALFVVFSFLD